MADHHESPRARKSESAMTTYILYHGGCVDGFGAAYAAWRIFKDDARYIECNYREMPLFSPQPGDSIYVLDFSFPKEVLLGWKSICNVRVFDHHESAKKQLEDLDFAVFDMNRSGSGIAWDEFHGGSSRPKLIDYIEDRDIWRNVLPHTEVVSMVMHLTPKSFSDYHDMARKMDTPEEFSKIVAQGEVLGLQKKAFISQQLQHAQYRPLFGFDEVGVVNTPSFMVSDLLHVVATKARSGIAMGWQVGADGLYYYNLRSMPGVDVSGIAESYGGGGHKAAAGFRTDFLL